MYLHITENAQVKLEPFIEQNVIIILDLDDGVGKYSKMGVCSIDTSFRLLLLDQFQDREDYRIRLDATTGEIYIKDYSEMYLDEEMVLDVDPRFDLFSLRGPSGTLDGNVPIVDLRPDKI